MNIFHGQNLKEVDDPEKAQDLMLKHQEECKTCGGYKRLVLAKEFLSFFSST